MSDDEFAKGIFECDSDDDRTLESTVEDDVGSGDMDEEEFMWNHHSTRLMLTLLAHHKHEFTTRSEREMVTKAVQRKMHRMGYRLPKHGVARKWNYLRTTFRRIAMANRKLVTWEYFDAVREILGSEADLLLKMKGAPGQRISYTKSLCSGVSSNPHIISIPQPESSPSYTCVIEANEESPAITFSHNIKIEDSSEDSQDSEALVEKVGPSNLDSSSIKAENCKNSLLHKDSVDKVDAEDIFRNHKPNQSESIAMQHMEEEVEELLRGRELQQKSYEMLEKIASQLEVLSKREDTIINLLQKLVKDRT